MARSFTGTPDFVAASSFPAVGTGKDFTIAAWVKTTNAVIQSVVGADNGASGTRYFQFRLDATGKIQFVTFASPNTATTTQGATALKDGVWHHIAGVCAWTTGATAPTVAYLDGVSDGTQASASANAQPSAPNALRIGSQLPGLSLALFNGSIQHVAYWSRALAAHEVVSLASGALPSHFAPDHYWPLWGADSPEPDVGVGTHVTGTLTGTAFVAGPRVGISLFGLETPFDYYSIPRAFVTGTVDVAITDTITTAGVATHFGSAAVAETVTVSTAGVATHFGSSTVTETVTVSASGGVSEHGTVAVAETVTVSVSGTAPVPPLEIVYSRVYGIELTLTDDGVEQVSRLVTSLDGF